MTIRATILGLLLASACGAPAPEDLWSGEPQNPEGPARDYDAADPTHRDALSDAGFATAAAAASDRPPDLVGVEEKGSTGPLAQRHVRERFQNTEVGALPAGWSALETAGVGTLARWEVAEEHAGGNRDGFLRLATRNSGQTYNLLVHERPFAADLTLRVRLKALDGREDQGGGLVWRLRDADNYYVTRWNPLERNVRLYRVVAGKREQLASAEVGVDPAAWHELEVRALADSIEVDLDGVRLLAAKDGTLLGAGRIGLWTKADAATAFDDLEVEWK